jgi:glycosyltransferase involved in cell wall biosynthesis
MKIVLFANTDWYLYNFRLDLAQMLKARGDEVVLVSPSGEYVARLKTLGFRWMEFPIDRRGMNPLAELHSLVRLTRLYRQERPALVHHFTIKCVLYGTIAARLTGVGAIVNSITGLGYVFLPGKTGKRLLRSMVLLGYRLFLGRTQVIFENEDDQQAFLHFGLIRPEDGHLIPGVGVDTHHFIPSEVPRGVPVILLASRLLWDKGIGEFVQASRHLRKEGVAARFALAGRSDPGNPAFIPQAQVEAWTREGVIEWWGWIEDMPKAMARTSIVCLPSYREGLPTVLIEAAACGRPVVASDVPGCRLAVQDGVSGLLVRERDAAALAEGLRRLIQDPGLCQEMGRAGRCLVEEMFSSSRILDAILRVYAKALAKGDY